MNNTHVNVQTHIGEQRVLPGVSGLLLLLNIELEHVLVLEQYSTVIYKKKEDYFPN